MPLHIFILWTELFNYYSQDAESFYQSTATWEATASIKFLESLFAPDRNICDPQVHSPSLSFP